MPSRRILLALALGAFVSACGSSGSGGGNTGPSAGTLYVTYSTPNTDDGALLVKVTGGAVTAVAIDTSLKGFSRVSANGDTTMIVVAGAVKSGVVAKLSVPDTRAVLAYSGTVLQVAQAATYAQRTVVGRSVVVSQ